MANGAEVSALVRRHLDALPVGVVQVDSSKARDDGRHDTFIFG